MPDRKAAAAPTRSKTGFGPASIVVGAGVVGALNFGKLPPALPSLQLDFGLSLVQASWMVSLFMFGAALFGIAGGSIADRFGPRRVMVLGLLLMGSASAAGALATAPALLFVSRAVESIGFLLAVLPGPALLRRVVPAASLRGWLGAWAAYMPAGMGFALIVTPGLMAVGGWRAAWWAAASMALLWAAMIVFALPRRGSASDSDLTSNSDLVSASASASASAASDRATGSATSRASPGSSHPARSLAHNALATAGSIGPWLLALCFLFYAGQFVGIFSFLPSVYVDAGVAPAVGALLTAIAVIANMVGNVAAGLLLQRGFQRQSLIAFAGVTMALSAWLAFGSGAPFAACYAAILLLSAVGGLIPGTLFATAPFYAPSPSAVSTTVGLMQQGSGLGQIALPPVIAALAQYSGGWSATWIATGAAAMVTIVLAWVIARYDRIRLRIGA